MNENSPDTDIAGVLPFATRRKEQQILNSQLNKPIVIFAVTLLASHLLWKYSVVADGTDFVVTLFGADISAPFNVMSQHISVAVHRLLSFVGIDNTLTGTTICHANSNCCRIVWGCTGIKQSFIFTMVILTAPRPHRHKLWFIPLGLLVVYVFNILRISLLTWLVRDYPMQFDLWHNHITKYIFYGIIFLMWVVWNDFLVPRFAENAQKQ